MTIKSPLLTLTFLASGCFAADLAGTIYPPLPDGWKIIDSACLGGSLHPENICAYSFGISEQGSNKYWYLSKSITKSNPMKARWVVTDHIPSPTLPSGFHAVFGLCQRNGKADETLVAIVKSTDTEWLTEVYEVYKANLDSGKFDLSNDTGVRCINDSWGI